MFVCVCFRAEADLEPEVGERSLCDDGVTGREMMQDLAGASYS